MSESMTLRIPVTLTGTAPAVADGGVVVQTLDSVEVSCLPGDIPERIDVDVTNLGINESLRVSDLQVPAKVKVLEAPDQVVVHVVSVKEEVAPTAAAAAPAEAEAAAPGGEPEVIKKGKKEEEGPAAE